MIGWDEFIQKCWSFRGRDRLLLMKPVVYNLIYGFIVAYSFNTILNIVMTIDSILSSERFYYTSQILANLLSLRALNLFRYKNNVNRMKGWGFPYVITLPLPAQKISYYMCLWRRKLIFQGILMVKLMVNFLRRPKELPFMLVWSRVTRPFLI